MSDELVEGLRYYADKMLHGPAVSTMREAADALESALKRISELEGALKPLARYYVLNDCPDWPSGNLEVPVKDLARVSALLPNPSEDKS